MHGQFIWYELATPDVDAAQRFYPQFTGWGTQSFDTDYTMWTTGGAPFAGLYRLTDEMRQQGVPPHWLLYVESDDVDATASKATSLGGRVMQGPGDIPGAGRYAVLQDPHGAAFGVYKTTTPAQGWDGTPAVGRFSWHELMTTDYRKAFEFYGALFGWEKQSEMDMGNGQMYFLFGKNGAMYGGMFDRPPEMAGMPPFWLGYIHVKDVGKAVAAATKAGAAVHRPQMDIPGGSIAILGDPQGAGFAVHHVSAPAAAAAGASTSRGAKKASGKKASGKKAASKKAASRKAASRKAAPNKKTTAKKGTEKKTASKKAASKKATRRAGASAARRGVKVAKKGKRRTASKSAKSRTARNPKRR